MARPPYPNVGSEYPDYYTLQVPPTNVNNTTHWWAPRFVWVWAKITNLTAAGGASIFVCEDDGGGVHGVEQEIPPGTVDSYYASAGSAGLYIREAAVGVARYQVQFRCLASGVPANAPVTEWGDRDEAALSAPFLAAVPPAAGTPGKGA